MPQSRTRSALLDREGGAVPAYPAVFGYNGRMAIPTSWRSHGTAVGWVVFALLSLPILAFAVGVGFSNGFLLSKVVTAAIYVAVVGLVSWLLSYGLSKGSIVIVAVAFSLVILILVVYAAAVSLLVGGLKIKIF